jgi:hypothetical protein
MVMFNSYVKLPEGTSFDPLRHAGFRPIAAWLIALRRQELADLSAYIGRIASCADRREMIVGIAQLFFLYRNDTAVWYKSYAVFYMNY